MVTQARIYFLAALTFCALCTPVIAGDANSRVGSTLDLKPPPAVDLKPVPDADAEKIRDLSLMRSPPIPASQQQQARVHRVLDPYESSPRDVGMYPSLIKPQW